MNELGQTYGSALDATDRASQPDLILAEGNDGTVGYVRKADFYELEPSSPEEAVSMARSDRPHIIPLYDKDGVAVIGEYASGRGVSSEDGS